MTISLRILTFTASIAIFVLSTYSCKKNTPPLASIYVVDQDLNPVSKISVRFYVKDLNVNDSALDTIIQSDDNGVAQIETAHDTYLDVIIQYKNEEGVFSISETTANLITNEHYVDTLIIYKPYVN